MAETAFNLATLVSSPPPFVDEGWYAQRAWALVQTGRPFGDPATDPFSRYDYFPWWEVSLHAPALWLFGPHLWALRLLPLLLGWILLAAVFCIGRHLGGERVGLLSTVVLAWTPGFLYSTHLARPDIAVAACGYWAIALCLRDTAPGVTSRSLASGLLIGLALTWHPNAVIFAPVVGALYLRQHGRTLLRQRRFWVFVLGLGLGTAVFIAGQIVPWSQPDILLSRLGTGAPRLSPILGDPTFALRTLPDTAVLLVLGLGLWLPLALLAIAILLFRRTPPGGTLLVVLSAVLILVLLGLGIKPVHYAILLVPAFALAIGAALVQIWPSRWPRTVSGYLQTAVVAGFVAVGFVETPRILPTSPPGEFAALTADIQHAVPSGGTVLAPDNYWFAAPSQPFFGWEQLSYYQRNVVGATFTNALHTMRPSVLVMDSSIDPLLTDDPMSLPDYVQWLAIPRTAVVGILHAQGHLVSSRSTQTFGTVRVYRLDWP